MEEFGGESSQVIFDHFRKCNFDAVLDAQERIKDAIERIEGDEENEGFLRQKKLVETLVEYYRDGAKDPKKAYKALSEIENEDKQEPLCEMNFLLEYNAGVFAYLSQMYGKALEHFTRILQNCEDAELFLVIKSAFNCLQVLLDSQYLESAKALLVKLEDFLPYLERIRDLKQKYRPTSESDKKGAEDNVPFDVNEHILDLEYFSVSTGSNLTQAAKAPKNPCIAEYEYFLVYFKARIAMLDCDEPTRKKWLKLVSHYFNFVMHIFCNKYIYSSTKNTTTWKSKNVKESQTWKKQCRLSVSQCSPT